VLLGGRGREVLDHLLDSDELPLVVRVAQELNVLARVERGDHRV
jgi:hypothetical protein